MVTQNIKVYRVNKDYYKFDKCTSNREVLKVIMSILNEKKKIQDKTNVDSLSNLTEDGVTYYLYVHKHKEQNSEWFSYFPPELTSKWDFKHQELSIILFVNNSIDIFVIVGGVAFQQIVEFIDHTFGLKLLSKIINPDEDEIVSINSRGLTGVRSGISEQYRQEIKVADFAKFGKLPTEIHLILSLRTTDSYFSFLKNRPNDRVRVYVGKSFKIKKNLTFEELKLLVREIEHIMGLEESDFLSSYIQETNRSVLEENFQPLLINKIFNDFGNLGRLATVDDIRFKFEFCNSNNMIGFYGADKYLMSEKSGNSYQVFAETYDRKDIYEKVLLYTKTKLPNPSLFEFRSFIQGIRVLAYQDGKKVCSGSFLYHFTSEFELGPQSVFLVDNRWYRLRFSFLQELKQEAISVLRNYKLPDNIFNKSWPAPISENQYNMQYHNIDKYMVFDTITPHGIELCDVLYIGDDATYLIHVKKGFDNSMRELTNQILLSSKRVNSDLTTQKKEYLSKIWNAYSIKYPEDQRFSFESFVGLFKEKIVYVLAFAVRGSINSPIISNIDKYKSNIAKYSLVQCSRDIQEYQYGLNICQIPMD